MVQLGKHMSNTDTTNATFAQDMEATMYMGPHIQSNSHTVKLTHACTHAHTHSQTHTQSNSHTHTHTVKLTGKQLHHSPHQYAVDEVKDWTATEVVKEKQHMALECVSSSCVISSKQHIQR